MADVRWKGPSQQWLLRFRNSMLSWGHPGNLRQKSLQTLMSSKQAVFANPSGGMGDVRVAHTTPLVAHAWAWGFDFDRWTSQGRGSLLDVIGRSPYFNTQSHPHVVICSRWVGRSRPNGIGDPNRRCITQMRMGEDQAKPPTHGGHAREVVVLLMFRQPEF